MDEKQEIRALAVYRTSEVAKLLDLSLILVQRYIRWGLLRATQLGRSYRVTRQALTF